MKYTNKYNLPESLAQAIKNDPYRQEGHISTTGVIKSPRMLQLERRHDSEIVIDVSERVFPLIGNNTHYIIERTKIKNALQEERFSCKILGWTVTSQIDDYSPPDTLSDYKVTSMWAVKAGVKSEWEDQLNIQSYLLRLAGFPVEKAQIIAIMRDWSKPRSKREQNYPEVQVEVLPVKLWDLNTQQNWLHQRVELHQYAEKLPDDKLLLCTYDEMWEKPTTYAVKKEGNKRATKVLTTEKDAENVKLVCEERHPKDKWIIEVRPGERTRCEHYCPVSQFCNQYKSYKEETNVNNSK